MLHNYSNFLILHLHILKKTQSEWWVQIPALHLSKHVCNREGKHTGILPNNGIFLSKNKSC